MQVGKVWVLNIQMIFLQVVAELHWRVRSIATFGTVVHLYAVVLPRVEDVLPDVLCTVGPTDAKSKCRNLDS